MNITDNTATNETDLLRAQIESLHTLYHSPKLELMACGAGMPRPTQIFPENVLLITRDEVFCILNRLRGALALRERWEAEHA